VGECNFFVVRFWFLNGGIFFESAAFCGGGKVCEYQFNLLISLGKAGAQCVS
jgi:hypothetical protein